MNTEHINENGEGSYKLPLAMVGFSSALPVRILTMSDVFDQPEVWLALQGFLVAFFWEMFQMPYFAMDHLSAWEVTKSCGIASIGDSGIMVFAYWIASRIVGDRLWLQQAAFLPVCTYLTTGLIITIAFEHLALRSDWGWQYSDLMPTIFGIGIVPIVMWIAVPLIALKFAARMVAHK